jgi:hypothetical protein
MPRLIAVRMAKLPMAENETAFWSLYKSMGPGWHRHLYDLADKVCYGLYVLIPFACLTWMAILVVWRGFHGNAFLGNEMSVLLAGISAGAALLFLVSTALVIAQARYRLPVTAITYTSILGVLSECNA